MGCAAYNCFNNLNNKQKSRQFTEKESDFSQVLKECSPPKNMDTEHEASKFVLQPYSRLCQDHFTEEIYQRGPKCFKSLGLMRDYF